VERKAKSKSREAGIAAVRDYFYQGPIAESLVTFCQSQGGLMTMADMTGFSVKDEPSVKIMFGDLEVHSCNTWTQGPVLLQTLGLLKGIDLKSLGHNSVAYIHTVVEAMKLACSDKDAYYGDPDFVDVPLDGLLSDAYCAERRKLIDPDRACPDMPPPGAVTGAKPYFGRRAPHADSSNEPEPAMAAADTTVQTVMDREGNIFCAAPSDPALRHMINPELGFGISPRGTQSWLHPNHPSVLAPGKRPRLTTQPVLALKNGKPYMAVCTPGGDIQPQTMLQIMLNIIVFGMNAQQATEAPRFATFSFPNSFYPHGMRTGELAVEARIDEASIKELESKGHKIIRWPEWSGNAGSSCVIYLDGQTEVFHAGADPRRDAYAIAW
jgi:gamma-glutamyltranspeptidase/glutathione hydrolase